MAASAHFAAFGWLHGLILTTIVVATVASILWARRAKSSTLRIVDRVFALLLAASGIADQLHSMLPSRLALDHSLPLHFCDWACIMAVWALWSRDFWAYSLAYYWGIIFALQGLLTPPELDAWPPWEALFHFASHGLTFIASFYLTFGVGLRPTWSSYRLGFLTTMPMFLGIMAFNHFAGTNYMYVNGKLSTPSILDYLGPWPWYVVVEAVIVIVVGLLMTIPWVYGKADSGQQGIQSPVSVS
jgi:hypothetical integral membrane protein (TIGR02206 family)